MADDATRAEAVKLAAQIARLALESYQGRRLAKAEEAALLAAVDKVERERVFTPTDEILGGGVKNPDVAGTPDDES